MNGRLALLAMWKLGAWRLQSAARPLWIGGACLLGQAAHAADDASALRINGYGTVGLTTVQAPGDWAIRRDAAQYPVNRSVVLDTDSRFGVQAHYELNPKWELASQVVLKRRLPGSKPIESLEWLFASYRPNGDWTLRFGRTNPDLFLVSDYRNVGVAYPWVRPNTEFYASLPLYTFDGADASYVWRQADARWRLKAFAGRGQTRATLASSSDQVIFNMNAGAGIILTREQDGLLLRATLATSRLSAIVGDNSQRVSAGLQAMQAVPDAAVAESARELERRLGLIPDRPVFSELGASYERNNWLWSAEYSRLDISTGTRGAQSAYVSLGRRLDDVTVYGMVGHSQSHLGALSVPNWSAYGQQAQELASQAVKGINASRVQQTSLSLGTRWDFHPQMALKVQWDHFWVGATGSALWVRATQESAQPNVGTVTLDFLF